MLNTGSSSEGVLENVERRELYASRRTFHILLVLIFEFDPLDRKLHHLPTVAGVSNIFEFESKRFFLSKNILCEQGALREVIMSSLLQRT